MLGRSLNPFVYCSLLAQARMLWDGQVSTRPPGIRVGAWRYLPELRMDLTPFGTEYHWENYLQARSRTALLDVRIGDRTFHHGWGGAGLLLQNLYGTGRIRAGAGALTWHRSRLPRRAGAARSR